ncbi:MAG: PKD domain-containing protein, partial [Ferruginibacter sp.]
MSVLILFNSSCIKDIIPEPTIADFSYSGALVTGNSITFSSSSTNASSYSWDFGDYSSSSTNTSTVANPQHSFGIPGDFTVTLTATGKGGTNSISKTLHIQSTAPACRIVEEVGSSIATATTWKSCHIYHCANFVSLNAVLTI